jgi:multiple sugar transport system permease protein
MLWVAGSVVLKTVVGLAIALLLDRGMRGRGVYRALSIIPWGLPWAIAAMMWGWTLNTEYGIVNSLLQRLELVGAPIGFLSRPTLAFLSLLVVDAWIGIPFMVVILEAGLKAIPRQLYESARVDGANVFQLFGHITLPQLKRVLITATLLSTVWTFNSFDPIWVLTQGGPLQYTETLPIAIYNSGFRMIGGGDLGLAAAMTVGQVLVVTVIALFYIRALKEGSRGGA